MQLHLSQKDIAVIAVIACTVLGASAAGWLLIGAPVLIGTLVVTLAIVATLQLELFRRFQQTYRQTEALFSLFASTPITRPLPPMRDVAASPDFATLIASLIYQHRPKIILEMGSGVSTLIAAYSLTRLGGGRLVSLEHHERYAAASAANVAAHQLDHIARVVCAPLQEVQIAGKTWLWYDQASLDDVRPIDLLIVDGPPDHVQALARYPALPILYEKLSDEAVIVMDDTARASEWTTAQRWAAEFTDFTLEKVPAEKGAVILRRQPHSFGHAG